MLSPRQCCTVLSHCVAVPQRTTVSPPLRHISAPYKWRVCTPASTGSLRSKIKQGASSSCADKTTNISLAGGKLLMTPKRAVAWTVLKKASCPINSVISYQSAFFLSCLFGHQSVEGWWCSKELGSFCKGFAPISSSQIARVFHIPIGL